MNYYKLIIEGLNEWSNIVTDEKKSASIHMLRHFIELMGEDEFNRVFKYQFIDTPEFDEGWYDFHKSMRQTDFFDMGEGSGHIDMLFWQFIHLTNLPYLVFKTFTEKIKLGVIGDFDNDIDGSKGWDKFGFFQIRNYETQS
jgi:hypothetical protein